MLPLPPPSPPVISPENVSGERHSYSPSLLIIAAILAFAIIAIASIHLLLRFLSRSRSRSHSPSPFIQPLSSSSLSSSSPGASPSSSSSSSPSDQDPKSVIDSLPLVSLSSMSMAAKSSSSLDCAVCLSPFEPRDELRLLPSCRHAFHSQCIDTWLRSTLSCPLCRSSILPPPPASAPPHPPPPETAAVSSSESFRVEIGSVSRRTAGSADDPPPSAPSHVRTYSLGSSFEYLVEEDVEAVLARIRRTEKSSAEISGGVVAPPGAAVAEMAGGGGSWSWLRDYVDRLASSASSSFSSIRWSRRFDNGGGARGVGVGVGVGVENWDLEGNLHLHLEEEDGGFSSFYRWLVGV